METMKIQCPGCKNSGHATFGGERTPFDHVQLKGDFKLEISQPTNVIHCKCNRLLVIVRNEKDYWCVIDSGDKSTLDKFARRLAELHRILESNGQMNNDWSLARSLEDRIGSLQFVSPKDICQADILLAKYPS